MLSGILINWWQYGKEYSYQVSHLFTFTRLILFEIVVILLQTKEFRTEQIADRTTIAADRITESGIDMRNIEEPYIFVFIPLIRRKRKFRKNSFKITNINYRKRKFN